MDTFQTMRLFAKVVEDGSLSAAGRRTGLSPAAVSRRIAALEDDLGVLLLHRSSRKLSLTEAGEIYLRRIEHILREVHDTNEAISHTQNQPRGTLCIHSRVMVANRVIAPVLPSFLAQYPEIALKLWTSNDSVDLIRQNIDIDIRLGKLHDSALMVRKLASSEKILCASAEYLARCGSPRTPADLASHSCLIYNLNAELPMAWKLRAPDGSCEEVRVPRTFETDNGFVLHEALLGGLGIALVPDWSIDEELSSGRLFRLFADHEITIRGFDNGVFAVYQAAKFVPAKTRVFLDFLSAAFRRRRSLIEAAPMARFG